MPGRKNSCGSEGGGRKSRIKALEEAKGKEKKEERDKEKEREK
jgi:hypothetical protein